MKASSRLRDYTRELFLVVAALLALGGYAYQLDKIVSASVPPYTTSTHTSTTFNPASIHEGYTTDVGSSIIGSILPDVVSGASDMSWEQPAAPTTRKKNIKINDSPVVGASTGNLTTTCAQKHTAKRDKVCASSDDPTRCKDSFAKYKHASGQVPFESGSKKICVTGKDAGKCSIVCGKKGFKKATGSGGTPCVAGKSFTEKGPFVCRTK